MSETPRMAPVPSKQTTQEGPIVGGGYVDVEALRGGEVVVTIDNRPCVLGAENGPHVVEREYPNNDPSAPVKTSVSLDLPVHVSDIPKRVTLPCVGKDYETCIGLFGPDLNKWIGQKIRISRDVAIRGKTRITPQA